MLYLFASIKEIVINKEIKNKTSWFGEYDFDQLKCMIPVD